MVYVYSNEEPRPKCKYCDALADMTEHDTEHYCHRCYIAYVLEPSEKNDYGKGKL